jgi:2-C-methyl-D-erythritol 4-phosphate cytidylyltransferase / 2-C-methyl-D-erythritol 2,4-cyclodiphosphate synthase
MTAIYALIAAAGRGERFRSGPDGGNKVFEPMSGRPMLRWTVEALAAHSAIDGIVVMVGARETAPCRDILSGVGKVLSIVAGGNTRQESVFIGLSALAGEPESLIAVHDGARPMIDVESIDRCLAGARANGNAVAAIPVADTLKAAGADRVVQNTVERAGLWSIQTPQVFPWSTLSRAHLAARDSGFLGTDDASLVEFLGEEPVHLVVGSPENIKVTTPADLRMAEAMMSGRRNRPFNGCAAILESPIMGMNPEIPLSPEGRGAGGQKSTPSPLQGEGRSEVWKPNMPPIRIGTGYDIHRFAEGRALWLGGVEFPVVDGRGLDGHSDADVLLHALCDALLGAAALPDIGHMFPNTDAAYAGVSSLQLLGQVRNRLADAGYAIVNVDVTVIAERPKIGQAVPRMREAIAGTLQIDASRVGIKATTNEGLGSVGEGMGIAAHAVACVYSL